MNTMGVREETGSNYDVAQNYDVTQNYVKLSGVEEGTVVVLDADSAEGVSVEISETGLKFLQKELERIRRENEQSKKDTEDSVKIMTIFRRIANGDIVPMKDEKKLMKHSMEMYQAAKNLASMKIKEKPKKYKSVDGEEEENGAISQREAIRALAGEDLPETESEGVIS